MQLGATFHLCCLPASSSALDCPSASFSVQGALQLLPPCCLHEPALRLPGPSGCPSLLLLWLGWPLRPS